MSNNTKLACCFLLLSFLLLSCAKDFEKLNTDPNRPKEITPGVMLGQLQYRIVNSSISASRNFTHELMQVDAPRVSTGGGGLHRYEVSPGAGVWSNFYSYMTDIQDIYSIAVRLNENNYRAIALVYKSWAYSILTDLYGDVPYSQATQAVSGNYQASFDKQKDIYVQLLKDLDSANILFNTTKALTYGGDMLYNANINDQITAILSDPVKYPVFTAITDDAIFRYPGSFPYFNPYYNARQLDWRDGTYFTQFFIDKMNTDNDPRRTAWTTTVTVGGAPIYRGIQSGYPVTVEYPVGQNSSYSDGLKTTPLLGVMMTYSEVEFIKAELALKGFTTGKTPKQHYEAGITASMAQWGLALPAGYLSQSGVLYDPNASMQTQLEKIMLQKYYAYFFVDYQSWFEKRRTGYPVLPRGSGIPLENTFPYRVPYPTYLQSLNPVNLAAAVSSMGGDNSNIKVWWDK